ncbi:MAG: hypothetical protein AABY22_03430 [Nanoarchaeota archaeon]
MKPKRDYKIFKTDLHWYCYLLMSNKWMIALQVIVGMYDLISFFHEKSYIYLIIGIFILLSVAVKLLEEKRLYIGVDYK